MSERQRRYRRRQREGLSIYRVPAGEPLLMALIAAKRLTFEEAIDHQRVEHEISAVLEEWASRWR